jgi:hypothetical protein
MENKDEKYSVRSLYEVIKKSLLLSNKDIKRYINTLNDELVDEYQKIKKKDRMPLEEIIRNYDNYYVFYLTIRRVLKEANINSYQENAREICNFFLEEELVFNSKKNKTNDY